MKNHKNLNPECDLCISPDGRLRERFSAICYVEVEGIMYNFLSHELEFFHKVGDPDANSSPNV